MARPANPDPESRRVLLGAATRLMLAKGFAATSLDDVCRAAHLTKGSIFHYFASKEELGAAVLDEYLARVLEELEGVRAALSEPVARLAASLDFLAEASQVYPLKQGCLLGRFSLELSETHPRIRARCARYFEQWLRAIAADLEEAGARPARARSLAEHTLAVFEGAIVIARASGDAGTVRRALALEKEHILRTLETKGGKR
jgi:TetR/AcrR family transcriptional repressor of nem operon